MRRLAPVSPEGGEASGAGRSSTAAPTVSGEALGAALGLSRAAVHKHVAHLRALGFAIESVGGAGYRLTRPSTDLVAPEAVLPFLLDAVKPQGPGMVGLPYRYCARCRSTNLLLKQAAGSTTVSAPAGMTVVTDDQTEGRGRLGRGWVSEPGKDLTLSVLLRPALSPAQVHLLSLAAALAVAEVLDEIEGLDGPVQVKWPNDVLLAGKKVCGILLEGSMDSDHVQWAVAGIGLNVNSAPGALLESLDTGGREEWRGRPAPVSLREHGGREVERAPLLARLLARLAVKWSEAGSAGLLEQLWERDALAGRAVEVLAGPPDNAAVVAGQALGIGPEGQLLVRDASGREVGVFAGEVTVNRFADDG